MHLTQLSEKDSLILQVFEGFDCLNDILTNFTFSWLSLEAPPAEVKAS